MQQLASATPALKESVIDSTSSSPPSDAQVTSEEQLKKSQADVTDAQLRAYFNDDLSLFSAEEIKKAQLTAAESLQGTYDQVSRTSFTAQQLQHVFQPAWTMQERSSKEGTISLKARLVDTSVKQQIFDLDMTTVASPPSYIGLKILLTLSLINRWDLITANIGSALLQAPVVYEEPVLVQPPPELAQSSDVLWRLTRALYGIDHSPKLWQHWLANKLEELGLRRNKVEPCIFSSEQLYCHASS